MMSDHGSLRHTTGATELLVKASFDRANGLTRRIPFRNVDQVTFTALKARVAECFALSSNFSIAYRDDDGDDIIVDNDDDLYEALDYMRSGEGASSQKCIMKIFIVVHYEGPNLSEAATSISGGTESYRSSVHAGCYCQGCDEEIVGPRYTCAVCPSYDLCSSCEGDEDYVDDSRPDHDSTHIMLKIKIPLARPAFNSAQSQADSLASGYDGDRSYPGPPSRSNERHPSAFSNDRDPRLQHGSQNHPPHPAYFGRGPPRHGPWTAPSSCDWNCSPGHGPPGPPSEPWHHRPKGHRHHGHHKGPHGHPPIYMINPGGETFSGSVQQTGMSRRHDHIQEGDQSRPW